MAACWAQSYMLAATNKMFTRGDENQGRFSLTSITIHIIVLVKQKPREKENTEFSKTTSPDCYNLFAVAHQLLLVNVTDLAPRIPYDRSRCRSL